MTTNSDIDWEVASLDEVLEQSAPYEQMVAEARAGVADLARQDYPRKGLVVSDEPRGWYHTAAEAGDMATCRMIDVLLHNGDVPQAVYDAAWMEIDALA